MRELVRLKPLSKEGFTQRLASEADELSAEVKRIDNELTQSTAKLNRSQLDYGVLASKQNELFQDAVSDLEEKLRGQNIKAIMGQEQLDNLRAELTKTTLDVMKVVGASQNIDDDEDDEDDDDLSSHASSLYLLIESLKEQFHSLEALVMSRTQRFLTGPIGKKDLGIAIYNDDTLISRSSSCIKFIGEEVLAIQDPDDPKCTLVYIPPPPFMITSFTVDPNLIEVGIIVTDVILNWMYSIADVVVQILTGPGIYPAVTDEDRTSSPTGLTEDRLKLTWNIKGTDPLTGITDNANVSLNFGALAFYGKSDTIPVTESEIEALANNYLGTGKTSGLNMAVSLDPDYMCFCYPESWGALGTVIDPQTGFEIPVVEEAQVQVENDHGYITMYRVYRSFQQSAGSFTWSFSGNSGIQLPPSL